MDNLTIGTKLWNEGDRCNFSHIATIVFATTDKWGTHYRLAKEDGSEYTIEAYNISDEFKGNASTRIVLHSEYMRYRNHQLSLMKDQL